MQQYTTFKLYKGSPQRLAQRLYHLKGILKGLPIVSWFNTHGSILEETQPGWNLPNQIRKYFRAQSIQFTS